MARRSAAARSHFSRGAHTVPPMPVVTCVSNHPERAPHQLTLGHGERLTRQRSRLTALGSCGESPNDFLFGAAGATGPATRSRGVALNGPQGDDELF